VIRSFSSPGCRARHYGERGRKDLMPISALALVAEFDLQLVDELRQLRHALA
jgi:hypothetical protein